MAGGSLRSPLFWKGSLWSSRDDCEKPPPPPARVCHLLANNGPGYRPPPGRGEGHQFLVRQAGERLIRSGDGLQLRPAPFTSLGATGQRCPRVGLESSRRVAQAQPRWRSRSRGRSPSGAVHPAWQLLQLGSSLWLLRVGSGGSPTRRRPSSRRVRSGATVGGGGEGGGVSEDLSMIHLPRFDSGVRGPGLGFDVT